MARSVDINLFKGFKNIEDGARPCPMRREAPIAEWGQSVGWCSVCKNKRNLFGRHNRGVKPGEEGRGEWIIENTFGLQKYREKTLRNLLRNVSFLSFSLFFLFTCTRVFLVCMILVTLPGRITSGRRISHERHRNILYRFVRSKILFLEYFVILMDLKKNKYSIRCFLSLLPKRLNIK